MSEVETLSDIIKDTTTDLFQTAGGFEYTDAIAVGLNRRWRSQQNGPVLVSALDLAWLLDGYARARLALESDRRFDEGFEVGYRAGSAEAGAIT